MCDPGTLAMIGGAAATTGGSLLRGAGHSQAEKAAAGYSQAEVGRQAGYRNQAFGTFDKTLGSFEKPKQDSGLIAAQDARTQSGAANVNIGNSLFAGGRAPAVIADAYKRAGTDAGASSADYARRVGTMEGYGDQMIGNATTLSRSAGDIDKFRTFARGSSGVLPLELQAAKGRGSTMRGIGDLLMGVGNLAALYGFTRPATAAASPGWLDRQMAPNQPWQPWR